VGEDEVLREQLAQLDRFSEHAAAWLRVLDERKIRPDADALTVAESLGQRLPDTPSDPVAVLDELVSAAGPGLTAMDSGRFFGWVIGGTLPAALGADLMTTVWDQNAGLLASSPAAAAVEAVASRWLLEAFDLPRTASVGFVTGGASANFTALAAARNGVLADAGWNVEHDGLQGAPRVTVIASEERHVTIDTALRYLGLGAGRVAAMATDGESRILLEALEEHLDKTAGPRIVALAAGNVNTGAFDPLPQAIDLAHRHGAWVHVDGAFGLWARATPTRRHLVEGLERADSWAVDAHKWLNVPYDCGLAIVARPDVHAAALGVTAPYLIQDAATPDPLSYVPEFSRRARGFAVWAALRQLGRQGIAEMIERCCRHATALAGGFAAMPGVTVLNDVVLNQVLVSFGDDATTRAVIAAALSEGTAFATGTTWHDRAALRVSVSNWRTTDADVAATLAAFARVLAEVRARAASA
jgi:glutamate/tyrosine decarboxylase-like PLP-dependent enzyme